MTTEPLGGTIRFLGVRASFDKAKELLSAALVDLDPAFSLDLCADIEAFLAQFEEPNPE